MIPNSSYPMLLAQMLQKYPMTPLPYNPGPWSEDPRQPAPPVWSERSPASVPDYMKGLMGWSL